MAGSLVAGPAAGAVPLVVLPPGSIVTGQAAVYEVAKGYAWSAVWLKPVSAPSMSVDYDLSVRGAGSRRSVDSTYAGTATDFVVFDAHHPLPDVLRATPTLYQGQGGYTIGYLHYQGVLANYVHIFEDWDHRVALRRAYLEQGECLAVRASNPGNTTGQLMVFASGPRSAVQPRAAAAAAVALTSGANTVTYVAASAGWHAIVLVSDGAPARDFYAAIRYQRVACEPGN